MTPEQIEKAIVDELKLDPERVRVTRKAGQLEMLVSVGAMTESEQRAVKGVLHRAKLVGFRVARHEIEGKPPQPDLAELTRLVEGLGTAPDGQLDKGLTARIRAGVPDNLDEMLRFIRNLRDECVFIGGASGFVMEVFSVMLRHYPEPDDLQAERRKELHRSYGLDD